MSEDLISAMRAEIAGAPPNLAGGWGARLRRALDLLGRAADAMQRPGVSESDVRAALADAVRSQGGQAAFARRHGIPQSVVSEALSGRRGIPESIANALGYVEIPKLYRAIAKG